LQARRNELSVVDEAILVAVDDLHGPLHVSEVNLDLRAILQPINQLFNRQLSITVNIDLCENLPQQLNLILGDPRRYQTQGSPLQLH
jgi:hypothetical protein